MSPRPEGVVLYELLRKHKVQFFKVFEVVRFQAHSSIAPPSPPVIFSKRHKDNRLKTGVHQVSVSQRAKEIPH